MGKLATYALLMGVAFALVWAVIGTWQLKAKDGLHYSANDNWQFSPWH